MSTQQVHTLILGAGPSGLAAGYILAKAGMKPVILERDKVPGGLMRSIRRRDFIFIPLALQRMTGWRNSPCL